MKIAITSSNSISNKKFDKIYLWDGGQESFKNKSVPLFLEQNADHFRRKYLSYIDHIGSHLINEKNLKEYFFDNENFSHWYMTEISEKNPQKTNIIYDVLRCFALAEMLQKENPTVIKYFGVSVEVKDVIADLWNIKSKNARHKIKASEKNNWIKIKFISKGIVYLMLQLLSRAFLRKSYQKQNLKKNATSALICSYIMESGEEVTSLEKRITKYWGGLPDIIKNEGHSITWLHIPISNKIWAPKKATIDCIDILNEKSQNDRHLILGNCFTFDMWIKIFIKWLGLVRIEASIRDNKKIFYHSQSGLNLWSFYKVFWYDSIIGTKAIAHLYLREMLDQVVKNESSKKIGLYLYEGQPWECAMLHSWRIYNHGKIIGVQHSSIGNWHLNNFNYQNECLPDMIAVNGSAAMKEFTNSGIPSYKLVSVEAIRYLYLKIQKPKTHSNSNSQRILILGDIDIKSTKIMLNDLAPLIKKNSLDRVYSFRPHPATKSDAIKLMKFITLNSANSIHEALLECDKVICANGTSASLDAYFMGKDVLIHRSESSINLNPLIGYPGCKIYKNIEELNALLSEVYIGKEVPDRTISHFWLDDDLVRWRELITNI